MNRKQDAYVALGAMAVAAFMGFWIHPLLGGAVCAGMVFYAWDCGL